MATGERRRHPRLAIRLPVAHGPAGALAHAFRHDFTTNISPGGVHLIVIGQAPSIGTKIELELTVPPGEGHFPYPGKIRGVAAVLRREKICSRPTPRWALAGRFDQPLDLDFK